MAKLIMLARFMLVGMTMLLLAVVVGQGVFADTSSAALFPVNTSSTSESGVRGNILQNIFTDFETTYHGPTMDKVSPYSVNGLGRLDRTAETGFDSEASMAFLVDKERLIGVGADVPFVAEPNIPGKAFIVGDVGIKWFNRATIKTENLQVSTDAYLQAPTSDAAHTAHMNFALRTTPWVIYNLAQSRWRVGSWSEFRYLNGVTEGLAFKAWVGPFVSYTLNDTFKLNLMFETEADHDIGQSSGKFTNISSDFQPGLIWQITPNTKINPYIQLFPVNHLATDTTAIGFVLYSRLM